MLVNQDHLRLLNRNTLFKGVPEEYLKKTLKPKNFINVKDGEILYSCNEEASEIYLVIEGQVKIKFSKENRIESKIVLDFFGEADILKGSERLSSAVANSDCVLYKMSIAELKEISHLSKSVMSNLNKKGIIESPEGDSADLHSKLNSDDPTKENGIIDFDQENEEDKIKKLSDEDLSFILEKQRSKLELDGDLNDKQKFRDEDMDDLSSDKYGEN